ncbi:amidase [Candidatus Nephthysia bennettiae]|uniref:Amidase n=1 Tax=Candidatus Nephthysia bennettiae TaxID=3127016 RepID=A0A934NAY6_9BACT|nr:amidase [Candidatus Dormibacteraeota bacterium]
MRPESDEFEYSEATVRDLQDGMATRQFNAAELTASYISRIEDLDSSRLELRAVIEINPEAVGIAEHMDQERRSGRVRGPLHGIPILVKDNMDTADSMSTTAGSMALEGWHARRDADVVARLRAAGAVVLGKTNLTEWSNFRSAHSVSGWSARGGQCRNPYSLDRTPWGSSAGSGVAVAANFAAAALGTETDGSIVVPSAAACLVGIKPTVGLTSRGGVIPISSSQDTVGPMARTVADAALVLSAIAEPAADYSAALVPGGLRGARIGIPRRKLFGYSRALDGLVDEAIKAMEGLGAVVVDPADLRTADEMGFLGPELTVLLYEFKDGINRYLEGVEVNSGVKSLGDLIRFNEEHREIEMRFFGQELFEQAQEKGGLTEAEYVKALTESHRMSRDDGIDAVMRQFGLDALVMPTATMPCKIDQLNGDHITGVGSTPAAQAGYPAINVPIGFVDEVPGGLIFVGQPYSEASLIRLAFDYEQATLHRRPPRFLPATRPSTAGGDS